LKQDYVSVVTKEPIREGKHYFQFDVHIEDEGWCGVTGDPNQAAQNPYPTSLQGWLYYCGRMRSSGKGGLQFTNKKRSAAEKTRPSGDVVGMAIDFHVCKIVFDLNGVYQGQDSIPSQPMWIIACVDRNVDKYVVNKLPTSEIPAESLKALETTTDERQWEAEFQHVSGVRMEAERHLTAEKQLEVERQLEAQMASR